MKTSKKNHAEIEKSQSDKFKSTAKEIEADGDEYFLAEAMKKIAKTKAPPKKA